MSPASTSSSGSERRLFVALLFLLAYALSAFFPPAALLPQTPSPQAWMLERLFPGTAGWMLARLLCLAVGAVLVASSAPADGGGPAPVWHRRPSYAAVARPWVLAAIAAAGLELCASFWAAGFGRAGQIAYVASWAAPALLTWLGTHRTTAGHERAAAGWAAVLGIAVVALVWLAIVVPLEWRSVLAADAVDNWIGLEYLERAARPEFNLLTDRLLPGVTATYTLLQGVAFVGSEASGRTFALVQAFHCFWLLVAGIGIGALAARLIGARTAPLAAATFLFAPFTLYIPLGASPFFIGPLFGVGLIWLLYGVAVRRAPAALVGLATVIGYTLTLPPMLPLAVVVLAAAGWQLRRGPRVPRLLLAAAALALAAAAVTGLPNISALREMTSRYALLRGAWADLEQVVLGERSPINVRELWHTGQPGLFDLPLASLLSPFGIPRTPLRLWGDALFDPIGAALAACGIAVCVRTARRRWLAAALLVLLATGLVPGFIAGVDRPSHTRMFVAPIALALLAGVGFEALTGGVARRRATGLAAAASAASALAGLLLFFVVNPEILAASATGIALRALPLDAPPQRAALLDYPGTEFSWLHVGRTATYLPRQPIAVWPLAVAPEGQLPEMPPAEVVLWSPALENDRHVTGLICRRWPDASLFTIWDRAHLSRAYAARRADARWQPALTRSQWSEQRCPAGSE